MNVSEINTAIERLEKSETNYENCSKLSILYIIRNNLDKKAEDVAVYSNGTSEFLQALNGAPYNEVMNIIDEHLECVKLLYPKEYTAIINKIKQL